MASNSELILEIQKTTKVLKAKWKSEIKKLTAARKAKRKPAIKTAIENSHESALAYFNLYEETVGNLGEMRKGIVDEQIVTFAETCSDILKNVGEFFLVIKDTGQKFDIDVSGYWPTVSSYDSMKRIVNTFCPSLAREREKEFKAVGLSTKGFKNKVLFVNPTKQKTTLWSSIGLAFFALIFLTAIFIPNPTPYQGHVFRVMLSLASAFLGALLPGFLEVESKVADFSLRAGGAAAFFAIVYLINPPALLNATIGD